MGRSSASAFLRNGSDQPVGREIRWRQTGTTLRASTWAHIIAQASLLLTLVWFGLRSFGSADALPDLSIGIALLFADLLRRLPIDVAGFRRSLPLADFVSI